MKRWPRSGWDGCLNVEALIASMEEKFWKPSLLSLSASLPSLPLKRGPLWLCCCEYTHCRGETGRDSSLPPLSGWGWGWLRGLTPKKITLPSSTAAGWCWAWLLSWNHTMVTLSSAIYHCGSPCTGQGLFPIHSCCWKNLAVLPSLILVCLCAFAASHRFASSSS